MSTPFRDALRDYSAGVVGLAAMLYVCGYIVDLLYYRLLGVEIPAQPLDYARFGADFVASLGITLLQIHRVGLYWEGFDRSAFVVALLCILSLALIAVRKRRNAQLVAYAMATSAIVACLLLCI